MNRTIACFQYAGRDGDAGTALQFARCQLTLPQPQDGVVRTDLNATEAAERITVMKEAGYEELVCTLDHAVLVRHFGHTRLWTVLIERAPAPRCTCTRTDYGWARACPVCG